MSRGYISQGLLIILLMEVATYGAVISSPKKMDETYNAFKIGGLCLGIASLVITPLCAFKHRKKRKHHSHSGQSISPDFLRKVVIGPPPPIPEDFPSPPPVRIYHKCPSPIDTLEKNDPLSLSLPDDD
uniref:Uncharacterized protein n=1 Tax=Trichuris muris TaxID=70415 RepID=A0A5S6Q9X4_TRIMR